MPRVVRAIFTAALILAPVSAVAHPGSASVHDFSHGFVHPLGGLDHVLAMVAVGLMAARLGGRALWLVPGAFVTAMAGAGAIASTGIALPYAETGIAISVIALGAVIAFDVAMPVAAAMAMAGVFASFHGHAHGAEMPAIVSGVGYGLGFVAATVLLHLVGIGSGLLIAHASNSRRLAQVAGGATAIIGGGILIFS
jgi:urease accessory protein